MWSYRVKASGTWTRQREGILDWRSLRRTLGPLLGGLRRSQTIEILITRELTSPGGATPSRTRAGAGDGKTAGG
jgi:hypothetical protein